MVFYTSSGHSIDDALKQELRQYGFRAGPECEDAALPNNVTLQKMPAKLLMNNAEHALKMYAESHVPRKRAKVATPARAKAKAKATVHYCPHCSCDSCLSLRVVEDHSLQQTITSQGVAPQAAAEA